MDAIISAGSTPDKVDPLLEYAQVDRKALIPIGDKPMIKWVTDALVGSHYLDRLIVVGLDPSVGIDLGPKPVIYVPPRGRLIANYVAGVERALEDHHAPRHLLIVACDIPLITAPIVDDHIAQMLQTDHDVYYSIIDRPTMLAKFPTSGRSYTRIREGVFCGGSIHMISRAVMASDTRQLWNDLLEARKDVLRQAWIAGFGTLLRLVTGTLTIAAGERRAEKILGVRCKVIRSRHAEIGMDVDKPFQLDIARAVLNS